MLGYGTADCPPVDVITGPGNIYVAAAKRLLQGTVAVDAEAGPTEIAIIADHTADPAFVAADLIAQAEHDPLAACLLIAADDDLADRVDCGAEPGRWLRPGTGSGSRPRWPASQPACWWTTWTRRWPSATPGLPSTWRFRPSAVPQVARRVRNAGAVFVGRYTPVSLGDYLAGSNHVLPTGGTARITGGLSVLPFLRGIHVVECSADALAAVAPHIDALGGAEDLAAHVRAVRIRVPAG